MGELRAASETRLLNLKNTDNKSLAAIVNNKLKTPLAQWAHSDQRGFVATRQELANVVEVDTAARRIDLCVGPGTFPPFFSSTLLRRFHQLLMRFL